MVSIGFPQPFLLKYIPAQDNFLESGQKRSRINNPVIICSEGCTKYHGTYYVRFQDNFINVGDNFNDAFDVLFIFYHYFNAKPCVNLAILYEFCKSLLSLPNKRLVYASLMFKLQNLSKELMQKN